MDEPTRDLMAAGFGWIALGKISFVLQVLCVIHAYRTGRPYWWMWVLFAVPGLGVIAYLILEVAPEFHVGGFRDIRWMLLGPKGRIAALQEQIEEADTTDNQLALASELMAQKRPAEAAGILESCARGVFKDDPEVVLAYADALCGAKQWDDALNVLARLRTRDSAILRDADVLRARALKGLRHTEQALEIWRDLELHRATEEAAYELAMHSINSGEVEEGRLRLEAIKTRYRKNGPLWRRDQRLWFRSAKHRLAEIKKGAVPARQPQPAEV